jgi:hypothetical protein
MELRSCTMRQTDITNRGDINRHAESAARARTKITFVASDGYTARISVGELKVIMMRRQDHIRAEG